MPYKERAKSGLPRKRPKSPYKVTNWTAYNRSLINRGRVSFYFPGGNVRAAFVNEIEYVEGLSGKQVGYLDPYIETLFMLKIVFRQGMRQITGFAKEYFQRAGLDLPVPSFGQLSDRFAKLQPSVKVRAAVARQRLKEGKPVDLIVDSTGLKLDQAGEWHAVKHRNGKHRRNWGKLHFGQTPEGDILVAALTDSGVSGGGVLRCVYMALR
ncbi:transposase [Chromobacterium amazonense]|uniref:transposase n=1 Tax=Chromobacterium amazonense TaxID=1382803 RepID=UPI003F799C75